MIYAYTRVSTDKQSLENQRFALQEFAKRSGFAIGEWVCETVSGLKTVGVRKLGGLFDRAKKGDTILISEISRLGRNIFMVMEAMGVCIAKGCHIISAKEGYNLGNDVPSVVMAFAFTLVAQIERDLISQRTKEALARRKAEGKHLGRKFGFAPAMQRLRDRQHEVLAALDSGATQSQTAATFGVSVNTLRKFLCHPSCAA